jgi:hypothetical protein
VIVAKARTLQIGACLSENMWPEAVQAAGYLADRSPTKSFDWVTPIETFYTAPSRPNPKPNLLHLRAFSCRAYAYILVQKRSRTAEIDPHAHIEYLVGYDSTNNYRVWIPYKDIVISVRDITFNETKVYNPKDAQVTPLLCQHIEEITTVIAVAESTQTSDTTLPFTEEGRPRQDAGPQLGENEGHEKQPPPVVLSSVKEEKDREGIDREDKMKRGSSKKRERMETGIKKFSRTIFPLLIERLVRALRKKKKWRVIAGTLKSLHRPDHERPYYLFAR